MPSENFKAWYAEDKRIRDALANHQPAAPQEPTSETRRPVRDFATSVGTGALHTAQGITGLTGLIPGTNLGSRDEQGNVEDYGTPGLGHLYQGLGSAAQALGNTRSEAAQRASENVMGAWESGAPLGQNVGSTLGAIGQNPYFLPNLIGEGLGSLGPTGKIAGTLGRMTNLPLPARVGIAEGSIYGGMVAGQVTEQNPDEYAKRLYAVPAAALAGTVGMAGSRFAGVLDPETLVASIMRGGVREARDIGTDLPGSLAMRMLGAAGVQGVQEGIQEGQQQAFINLGTDRPIGEGVGQASTIGAVAGIGMGGAVGGFSRPAEMKAQRILTERTEGGTPPAQTDAADSSPIQTDDAPATAPARAVSAMQAVATEMVRIHDNLTPEAAAEIMGDLTGEGGTLNQIATGREGVQQVMDALGITPENLPRAVMALVGMTGYSNQSISAGARYMLGQLTGLNARQVRSYEQMRTNMLDKRIGDLERTNSQLESQIKRVGEVNPARTAARTELMKSNQSQLTALQAYKTAIETIQEARNEGQRVAQEQRLQQARGVEAGQMFGEAPVQAELPLSEAGQPTTNPTVDAQGQVDFIGRPGETPAQNVGQTPPGPTIDATGQVDMFGQPGDRPVAQQAQPEALPPLQLEQVDAAVDPSQQQLDLQPPVDPAPVPEAGLGQRPLLDARSQRRADRAERTTQTALQRIAEMPADAILQLPDNPSLAQLSRLTGIRQSTMREMSREAGSQQGSPMDVVTRAIAQRKQEVQAERTQIESDITQRMDADPTLTPARAIQQAAREARAEGREPSVRKLGDLPPDAQQRLRDYRKQNRDTLGDDLIARMDADPYLTPARAVIQAANEARQQGRDYPVRRLNQLPSETRLRLEQHWRGYKEAPPGPKSEGPARGAGPLAQLRPAADLRSMTTNAIDRIVSGIVGTWKNAPPVTIVENPLSQQLPPEVRDAFTGQGLTEGVFAQLNPEQYGRLQALVAERKQQARDADALRKERVAIVRAEMDGTLTDAQRARKIQIAAEQRQLGEDANAVLEQINELSPMLDKGFRDISHAAQMSIMRNSRNFFDWFRGSRVRDGNDRPMVVYHGTSNDITSISSDTGINFFTDSSTVAASYGATQGRALYPVFLQITQPLDITPVSLDGPLQNTWYNIDPESAVTLPDGTQTTLADLMGIDSAGMTVDTNMIAEFARDNPAFDGVIFRNMVDPGGGRYTDQGFASPLNVSSDVYVTFDGTQAKSAVGNNGQFSRTNPEMNYKLGEGQVPAAIYYDGQVYLDQNQMHTPEDVATAVYHEMVGHFGLRNLLGEQLDTIMDQVAAARVRDVAGFAERYGLDMNKPSERRLAAEEFVAHMAESLPNDSFVQRVVDLIRSALTDTWLGNALGIESMNDSVIRTNLLRPAMGFVVRGEASRLGKGERREMLFKLQDPGSTPRPDTAPTHDILFRNSELKKNYMASLRETARDAKQALAFTTTIMWRLAERIPATRALIDAGERAQHIAGRWERRHQELGSRYVKVGFNQYSNLTKALVDYTKSGTMPFLPQSAAAIVFDAQGNVSFDSNGEPRMRPLGDKDVKIDDSLYKSQPQKVREAIDATFESTAELQVSRAQNSLRIAKDIRDNLIERGEEPAKVDADYRKAINQIASIHNNRITRAYVPLARFGKYSVEAYSPEYMQAYRQLEQAGFQDAALKKKVDELRRSGHYNFQKYETQHEAEAAVAELRRDPTKWELAEHHRDQVSKAEYGITDYQSLAALMDYIQAEVVQSDSEGRASDKTWDAVNDGVRRKMRDLLVEMGQLDSETASQMDRQYIDGVVETQVMPNTLEHIKHYGFVAANSATNLDKVSAIGQMRQQLGQLKGADSATYVGYFNNLMQRINDPFDNAEGWMTDASRKVMGVSSLYLLLSNPTYYMMNALQTFMLTAPILAGEVGFAKSWGEIAKAYAAIKPIYKGIAQKGTELNFDSMPERQRNLLTTLQERNILDVGMTHEFGSLHQGRWGSAMQKLYNAARSVELINRSTAALASYNSKVDALTKGRKLESFDAARQEQIHNDAIDFAHWMVYRTHGDYSYNNANMVFRQPMLRAALQFKKIGQIQAELLYDRAKAAWAKPKVSERSAEWFQTANIEGTAPILAKIDDGRWITEAERAQLEQLIRDYQNSDASTNNLSPRDLDYLPVLLQEFSADSFSTLESAAVAKKSFAYVIGQSTAVVGTLSVPFATTIAAMAMRLADSEEDKELDETSQATIKRYLGPEMGNLLLRGAAANVFGVDVSHRIGINFVEQFGGGLYNRFSMADPQRSVNETVAGLVGPPASLMNDMFKGYSYLEQYATTGSQHDLAKGLASVSPLGMRNLITAKLLDQQGLVSDSRMSLIPREEFTDGEIIRKAVGFQPSRINEFYDMRQHMQQVEQAVNGKRLLLKRSYFEAVESNDQRRINRVMEQWRDLQEDQRSVDMVASPISELPQFVRQKRRENQRVVNGILPTSRNRELVERIAGIHTTPTILEQDLDLGGAD